MDNREETVQRIAAILEEGLSRKYFADNFEPVAALESQATEPTHKEVMPDTPGSRSNSGDNATPQASTLAPGADAPESDLRALAREIPLTRMNEVGARDILEKALEKAYRLGLTRSPGTKEQEHE